MGRRTIYRALELAKQATETKANKEQEVNEVGNLTPIVLLAVVNPQKHRTE